MPKFIEGYASTLEVPAGARDVQVFDTELPGFGIRKFAPSKKHPNGFAAYFVKFNVGHQQRRLSLGAVVRGNLADMRKRASTVLSRARLGQDVVADKRAAASKVVVKLGELISTYLAERENDTKPGYHREIKRQLERDWKSVHGTAVDGLTRQAVVEAMDEIAGRQGNVAADRARIALSGFYGWAIDRGYCEINPTMNIRPRAQNGARDRVLSEVELAEVWRACEDDDFGRIVRLLILTGQRRQEIGDLSWHEVNTAERQIELPGERTKNGRAHVVPLSDEALALLPEKREDRDFVFGRGAGGYSGWSKAKAELDARIAVARKKAGVKKPMPAWVLHDLRRSLVTNISERGFAQPHIIEAICNHVSGHKAGVAGVYNRATYLPEKRQALEAWGRHVAALVTRGAAN